MSMRLLGVLLPALLAVLVGSAYAEAPANCRTADVPLDAGFPLAEAAKALAAKRLNILVVGAGSSELPGSNGNTKSYPARLQAALRDKFPGVSVTVQTDVKVGRTAASMVASLRQSLATAKPDVVIWQTGTVDAMRLVGIDAFNTALDKGITMSRAAGADVVFVNAQYSPRLESIIAVGDYLENLRRVALQREVPVFDRYAVMKGWAEHGTFDFYGATKKLDTAERVHDCIGQLLADLLAEASKAAGPTESGR